MDRLLSLRLSQLYYIYYFNGQEDPYLNIFEFIKKVEDELFAYVRLVQNWPWVGNGENPTDNSKVRPQKII